MIRHTPFDSPPASEPRQLGQGGGPASALPELAPLISISTYMADARTRVVDYNGRKLISILGEENFSGERVVRLPSKVVEFAIRQPITSALLPCRAGFYPHARGQKVSRPNGDWSHTLLFCLDGAGRLDLRDSHHRMTRGAFALLRPFEFHSYEADGENPWSFYWIHFNGRMAQEYQDAFAACDSRVSVPIEFDVKLLQSFERILSIYAHGHAYRVLVQASTALHQLFGEIHGLLHQRSSAPESVRAKIERTIEVMRANPDSNLSIQEFAAAAHTSQMYFAAKFREFTGESPRSYFSRIKMEKACEYLVKTRIKVEDIAQMVGYSDPFYFSRAFKRIMGQTPSHFRSERSVAPEVDAGRHDASQAG